MDLAELDTHIARGEDCQLTLADLDLDAFENYLKETGLEGVHPSQEQLLVNWRLLSADRHPTLAGMILFGRHPQRHLPFAQINAARIPGTELANDPSDRKDLTGRLFDVTRVGSGIPRMIELVKKATGRELEIEIRDFEVTFVIPRPKALS